MASIPIWKMESVGNDFVLVHPEDVELARGNVPIEEFLTLLAVKACDRHFGVGSDGLLALQPVAANSLMLRMFNPDGSEDFCGNGVRCAIAHGIAQGWLVPGADFTIDHFGKHIRGSIREDGEFFYSFEPGTYDPATIPHTAPTELFDTNLFEIDGKTYRGSVLSTGTAHTILPVPQIPNDEEFFRVSPQIEHHPMFPERTSLMWVKEEAPSKLRLRIWERGAGETWGCGSGSAAAAIDYIRRTGTSVDPIKVENPGGTLEFRFTRWNECGDSFGPAREVFRGQFFV